MDLCIYQGGVGSGKTWVGSLLGIMLAWRYPGIFGLVLAKTYPMVRDTTMRTYLEHLDAFKMRKNVDYTFNKSESRLIFPNWGNSEIIFRHLQDPEKIKSINAGFIQAEEVSQFSEADFEMCLTRLRQVGISRRRFFGTTNPQAAKGWIYERFVENNPGQIKLENDEVIHYRRVIAPTTDNKALPASYIENLKNSLDTDTFKIFVLGEDGNYTAGLVSYNFDDLNLIETSYKPDLCIYLSCDFNVDPMSWVLAHRYNGEYHFFDEIVIENTNIDQCVEEFIRRYPKHTAGVIVTGDASGNSRNVQNASVGGTSYTQLMNVFNRLNYPSKVRLDVRQTNPSIADRVSAWNSAMCNSSGVRRIYINPCCKHLVRNLNNLKYQEGTGVIDLPSSSEIKKDSKLKFMGHIFDAASYLVEKYDPITFKPVGRTHPGVIVHSALRKH